MVWYSHLFQNFLQFIVIHMVKSFGIVNKILWPQPLPLAMVHTLKGGFSLDPNKSAPLNALSLNEFLHQSLSFISFGRA